MVAKNLVVNIAKPLNVRNTSSSENAICGIREIRFFLQLCEHRRDERKASGSIDVA